MISSPFRRAGLAVLALWAAMVQAVPPERITLTYELKRNGTVLVDVSETLEHDGRTYAITSEGRGRGILALFGVLKRTSRGHITPQGLRPPEFRDERPGGAPGSGGGTARARGRAPRPGGRDALFAPVARGGPGAFWGGAAPQTPRRCDALGVFPQPPQDRPARPRHDRRFGVRGAQAPAPSRARRGDAERAASCARDLDRAPRRELARARPLAARRRVRVARLGKARRGRAAAPPGRVRGSRLRD